MKKKIISIVLSLAIIVSVTPIVSAQGTVDDTAPVVIDSESINQTVSKPYIVGEITEKRTKNTKHFLMSDRSMMAAMYDETVHYNDNGTWVDIDNSFSTNGENEYENKSNSLKTKFSKKSNGNKLVTVTKDNYSLSWMLDDAKKVNAQISQSNETESEDMTVLKNIQGSVTYPDIQDNVDLQYIVSGSNIKENIILHSADAPTEYTFTYIFNKLNYRTNDNNQIEFYDENNPENIIFVIDTPYMCDNANAYSNSIEIQISETNNGFCLTLVPNKEWLLSEDRVYPIVIDPSVLNNKDARNIWDTTLQNGQSKNLGYTDKEIFVGSDTSGNVYRTLMKFVTLPDIDIGGIIVNARMTLTAYPGSYGNGVPVQQPRPTDDIQVNIHRVNVLWPQQGSTWSGYADKYESIVEDYFIYNDTDDGFTADITNLVSDWYKNPTNNYGVMIKAANESAANHVMQLTSSDWGDGGNANHISWRPILEVNYRTCIGLEDYWSYTTQDMGGYGTGYVNNYNGNLTYVHNDVSFNSLVNGFTLSHVYNCTNTIKEVGAGDEVSIVAANTGRYGKGWSLNLVQTLKSVTIEKNEDVKFVYTDGDGTKHYFVELDDDNIVDEDGLGYTYSSITEGELIHKLTDKDNNVLKFDEASFLRKIIDSNGNSINLNYSPGPTGEDNCLTSVTTSSGGTIQLNYDSEYKLTSIIDNASRITTFSYANGNLTKITYPDGTDLDFEYCLGVDNVAGSTSWLHGVILPDNYQYRYGNYNDGKIYVSSQLSASKTQVNNFYYTYSNNTTTVQDLHNRNINYLFDSFGRVTCAFDSQGNSYSESYTPTVTDKKEIFSNNKLSLTSNNIRYINNLITNGTFTNGLTGWAKSSGTITVSTEAGLLTSNSVKIVNTASNTTYIAKYPTISVGKNYTVSAYIKTQDVTSSTQGAGIKVTTSNNRNLYSDFITGTTNEDIDNGFKKVSCTFSLESGESLSGIFIGLYNSIGTLYIDSVQFEESDTAHPINLISNSSFESNSGNATAPASFVTNFGSIAGSGASNAYQKSGSYSCKLIGCASETRSISQRINISGKAGDVYSFGGWGMANSVATTYSSAPQKPNFRMYLNVYAGSEIVDAFELKYNEHSLDWQYASKAVILTEDYTMLEVYFTYDYNCNTAYFDDIFLYRDTAQSYQYDEYGNVKSTADYAAQQSGFTYNDDNTLSKVLNPDGSGYEYSYNNHLLYAAKSEQGVESKIERDSYGNATESYITSSPYTTALTPGKTYRIRNKFSALYITNDTYTARQYAYDMSANKSWILEDAGEGYYRIIWAPYPTDCLTLSTTMSGYEYNIDITPLAEKDSDEYQRQLFKFKVNGDGSYEIVSKLTPNESLRPLGAVTSSAARVTSSATNNFDYFCWYFEDTSQPYSQTLQSGSTYRLRALHSGMYLDMIGTFINQYPYYQNRPQRFIITEHSGYYTITLADSPDKYMALDTSQTVSGNPVIAVKSTFDDSCKFAISTSGAMGAVMISPISMPGYSLTVDGASLNFGVSVVVATDTEARNQRFVLEPASDIIRSSATYQNNGNHPHTVTDSRGNTTTYTYDADRGLQTGVTDAKGNTTVYEYDPLNDRLDYVISGGNTVEYYYNSVGQLTGIDSPSATQYTFGYDEFGNQETVFVGTQKLTENHYDTSRGLLDYSVYGNGQKIGYTYDILDRVTEKLYNEVVKVKFRYDKFGNLYEKQDLFINTTYRYEYDLTGRITGVTGSNNTSLNYIYDKFNRIEKYIARFGNNTNTTKYIYGDSNINGQKNGLIYGVKQNDVQRISYAYDELARLDTRTLNTTTPFVTRYGYHQGATAGTTTTLVKTVQNGSDIYEYSYDSLGNITQIKLNGTLFASYTYDALNQLKTETLGGNVYEYTYGSGGNIQSVKKNGTVIKAYGYQDSNWRDLLTEYNGDTITYDEIGNPLQYRDGFEFTWSNGRQLTSVCESDYQLTTTYTYNADGLRASKNQYGVLETQYYWLDGVLLGETCGGNQIIYLYDENSTAYGIIYNGVYYYYVKNVQGDIVALLNADGEIVAQYEYDAWGNTISITDSNNNVIINGGHIAHKNPLRYRGYYYDEETGLYYVSSRYYDPEIGRWINADNQLSTGSDLTGMNLFAYCGNNPVNRIDPTGEAWWHWALGAAVVAACAVATVVTCGGFAAAATAVCMVGSGVAAATTASTVAAAAFIGSATVYGTAVLAAASSSNSIEEFNAQGNWGTVAATAGGAVFNGAAAYAATRTPTTTVYRSVSSAEAQDIKNTGQFNLAPGGMESKQFGFNLSETRQFGNMMGQNTIVSAKVPNSMLNQLYTGGVDTSIFRAGTLTVYGDQLGAFNQAVSGTIKFMP